MRPDDIGKVLVYEYMQDLYNTYYSHRTPSVVDNTQKSKKIPENKITQVGNSTVIDMSTDNYSVR